ncbi:hypothetical protein [Halocola ammonii]
MVDKSLKRSLPFWGILAFVVGWTVLLFYFSPREIVEMIGVSNSYLVVFLVAVIGAFSSFTTFSAYPVIVTMAAGKLDPLFIGLVAGIGLAIGDTFFYYFGVSARGVASSKLKNWLSNTLKWLKKKSDLVIQLFIFGYVGFTPFPNNILTGLLALSNYPYRKVALPLILGDLVLPIVAAYLSAKGVEFFFS